MMTEDLILMPKNLTAENGAKELLSGELKESVILMCEVCDGNGEVYINDIAEICDYCSGAGDYALEVTIGWDTIKDIYAKYVEYYQDKPEGLVSPNYGGSKGICGESRVMKITVGGIPIKEFMSGAKKQ